MLIVLKRLKSLKVFEVKNEVCLTSTQSQINKSLFGVTSVSDFLGIPPEYFLHTQRYTHLYVRKYSFVYIYKLDHFVYALFFNLLFYSIGYHKSM